MGPGENPGLPAKDFPALFENSLANQRSNKKEA